MPPKSGKDGDAPAKTPTSSATKLVRRDITTTTQDPSITTPTTSIEVALSTGHAGSPHASNADDGPELVLD